MVQTQCPYCLEQVTRAQLREHAARVKAARIPFRPSPSVPNSNARAGRGSGPNRKPAEPSERVAIDADTVAALTAHKLRQAAERQPDWPYWGLVFTTPHGYPIHRRDVLDAFRLACDRAGVKRRRFHDLRHSSATLMREVGITGEVRKARLGHSTDDMSERYAHASATQDRDAVERLAEAVR